MSTVDIFFDTSTGTILGAGKCRWAKVQGKDHMVFNGSIRNHRAYEAARLGETIDFITVTRVDEYVSVETRPGVWKIIDAKKVHPNRVIGDRYNLLTGK